MLEKAVHCLGILHYGWAWNLASKMDGTSSEAKRPGFRPEQTVRGIFGDPNARVITLKRRSKKRLVVVAVTFQMGWYDRKVRRVRDLSCGGGTRPAAPPLPEISACRCGKVKQERLDFLAAPFQVRSATVQHGWHGGVNGRGKGRGQGL
jgi:hypothetical protein